jgi:hypothetical protein
MYEGDLMEYLSAVTCAIIRGNGNRTAIVLAAVPALFGFERRGFGDHDADRISHLAGSIG